MASTLQHLITAHNVTGFPMWPSKIQLFCLLYATTTHFKMDQLLFIDGHHVADNMATARLLQKAYPITCM